MKRLVMFGVLLGVVACAPKTETPPITGVTYDRLFREGWEAYAEGDYALAEAKFDSILKYVTVADPVVHLSKALAMIPQGRNPEGVLGVAFSLLGKPFVEETVRIGWIDVLDTTRAGEVGAEYDILTMRLEQTWPVPLRLEGLPGSWKVNLVLGPSHAVDSADIVRGSILLGKSGERVSLGFMKSMDDTVIIALPKKLGDSVRSVDVLDLYHPIIVEETTLYVPGETLVVVRDTQYNLVTLAVHLAVPAPDDSFEVVALVRDPAFPGNQVDTVHAFAYLVGAVQNYYLALSQNKWDEYGWQVVAYADAMLRLIHEKGWNNFQYPISPGLGLENLVSERMANGILAEAYFHLGMFSDAVRALNEFYGTQVIDPAAPVDEALYQQILQHLQQVRFSVFPSL